MNSYSNVGRLSYAIGQTILWIGGYILAAQHSNAIITCLLVLVGFLNIALVALRLQNIGVSMWFTLTSMIPFVNIILVLFCLIAPSGYRYHRQMDTAGVAIIAVLATVVAVVIVLAIFR